MKGKNKLKKTTVEAPKKVKKTKKVKTTVEAPKKVKKAEKDVEKKETKEIDITSLDEDKVDD